MNDGLGVAPRPPTTPAARPACARLLEPATAPSAALAPHGAGHDDQHQAVTQDLVAWMVMENGGWFLMVFAHGEWKVTTKKVLKKKSGEIQSSSSFTTMDHCGITWYN